MGPTNYSTMLLRPSLLLLLVVSQCHGSWFNWDFLTPCNKCTMDSIKLTEGNYPGKLSTPANSGIQPDANGCPTLTVTCIESDIPGDPTFMLLNNKTKKLGSARSIPLVCNAKGEWGFQYPGMGGGPDSSFVVTEVTCTHDANDGPK